MKPILKRKHELMSDCLKLFNQLPPNLQSYGRSSNPATLHQLITCSNKFTELATESQELIESQMALFHRFFCRIRDIIYSFLTYYLHMQNFIHIRELLMEVNKLLLQYRPGLGHSAVLLAIGAAVRNCVGGIASSKHFTKQELAQLMDQYVKFQPKENQPEYPTKQPTRKPIQSLTNRQNQPTKQNQPQKEAPESELSKLYCLDNAITDIDYPSLDRFATSNSDDLYNECLNRNRFISQIMKRYSEKYRAYQSRPVHRRNRVGTEYRPTTYHIDSPIKVVKKRSIATSHGVGLNKTISPKEKMSISNISETFAFVDQNLTQQYMESGFKEEIINHLYAYRQKCCLRKIVIGAQEIQPSQISHKETLRQFHRRNNKSSNAKSERAKTYSQRFQVLKNTKCYISGVVSVPFRKIDV